MSESIIGLLGSIGSTVFRIAVLGFLVVNGVALAAFLITRRRSLVDTWTPRLVTIDAVLLGAGLGIPLLTSAAKLGVKALAGMGGSVGALFR